MDRRVVVAAVAVVVIISLAAAVYLLTSVPGSVTTSLPSSFSVNGKTFPITYTASTEPQREHGLMNTKVTNTTIMLFAWPTAGKYQFWMYDTNTSLDMIWVNATGGTGSVVYVVTGAPPCYDANNCAVYTPTSAANYVFEAKAGFAQSIGIVVGSTLLFS
jgi:uncharacterized membrane protein (UPF0127 family)